MKVEIEISAEAYEIIKKTAEIKELTTKEFLEKQFEFYEKCAIDPEKTEGHYKVTTNHHLNKKAREVYNKHHLQEFYLNKSKNGKKYKTICWRTCPVQPATKYDDILGEMSEHVGEYWYEIRHYDDSKSIAPGFCHVEERKTHYRKTLKALKKAINKEIGYDHYKMKK